MQIALLPYLVLALHETKIHLKILIQCSVGVHLFMSENKHTAFSIQGSVGALVENATHSTVIGTVGNIDIGKLESFVTQALEMIKFLPDGVRASALDEINKVKKELDGERRNDLLRTLLISFGKIVSGVRDNMIAGALTALLAKEFGLTFLG